jgi:hypothetical protein
MPMPGDQHAPEWPPADLDVSKPTIARAYDALLGGENNFPADRALAHYACEHIPGLQESALENRKVLVRGVRYLAGEAGIDQFLDLGSGLPTVQNTHEVAQARDPLARVACVDIDPLVLTHGRAILAENDNTTVVTGDVREPAAILGHPEVTRLVDFDRPAALMLGGLRPPAATCSSPRWSTPACRPSGSCNWEWRESPARNPSEERLQRGHRIRSCKDRLSGLRSRQLIGNFPIDYQSFSTTVKPHLEGMS